jgi:hypothetical protein
MNCLQKIENNILVAKLTVDINEKYLINITFNLLNVFNNQNTISYSKYVNWSEINKSDLLKYDISLFYDPSTDPKFHNMAILIYFDRIKTNYIMN